jgi:hypothetical protein
MVQRFKLNFIERAAFERRSQFERIALEPLYTRSFKRRRQIELVERIAFEGRRYFSFFNTFDTRNLNLIR